jgi:hypothetical protein
LLLLPDVVREVQVPLLSSLLLGGSAAKLVHVLRERSFGGLLGPTALFPVHLRRPAAIAICATEFALGVGLILTAGSIGGTAPANAVRLGTALLFLVATCALIELRAARPDIGCGCFGDFSTAPVSGRALARSALLAGAALITIGLGPLQPPRPGGAAILPLGIFAAELVLVAALSPEVGEGLVRLGYSEPCELRAVPAERTLASLRRSSQWRRHAGHHYRGRARRHVAGAVLAVRRLLRRGTGQASRAGVRRLPPAAPARHPGCADRRGRRERRAVAARAGPACRRRRPGPRAGPDSGANACRADRPWPRHTGSAWRAAR